MMRILIVFLFSFLFLFFGVSHAQETGHVHKPYPHKHKQYAREKNPVPMTAQSIEKGRELFGKFCIGCHRERGKGVGNLNLTDDMVIHGDTDGEIFHVITDGVKGTQMKEFKKELTNEMRWHLVNYVKDLKLISVIAVDSAQENSTGQYDQTLRRGETRSTLDPNRFNDPSIRQAYRVAKEIPWVLDSIYCYCQCEESTTFRHKSLLSCYVDNHAAI